jgi:hypothetical protein
VVTAPMRVKREIGPLGGGVGLEVDTLTIRIPMRLQRRGGRKLIMTPEGAAAPARKPRRDETLVKALLRAHYWRRKIESGQANSITDLPKQEGGRRAPPREYKPCTGCSLLPLSFCPWRPPFRRPALLERIGGPVRERRLHSREGDHRHRRLGRRGHGAVVISGKTLYVTTNGEIAVPKAGQKVTYVYEQSDGRNVVTSFRLGQ